MKRSEVTVKKLEEIGWRRCYHPDDDGEPTIKDIAEYLHDGFYDCKVEFEKNRNGNDCIYERETYEGIPCYQHRVVYKEKKELMYCRAHDPELQKHNNGRWTALLYRYVVISRWQDPWMGD